MWGWCGEGEFLRLKEVTGFQEKLQLFGIPSSNHVGEQKVQLHSWKSACLLLI